MQGRAKLRGTRNALRILPRAGPHVHPFDAETFRLWKLLLTRGAHSTPCAERATRYDAKIFACEETHANARNAQLAENRLGLGMTTWVRAWVAVRA